MNPMLVFEARVSPQARIRARMTAKLKQMLTFRLHQSCVSQTRAWQS